MKYSTFKQRIKSLPVFYAGLLSSLTEDTETRKVQLSGWKKKGLVVRLRKGVYVLGKEDRIIEPSLYYLANQIFIPSYLSLESALAFYGLIPDFVGQITSVTTRKTCEFKNEFGVFSYQHLKQKCYTGFDFLKDENNLNTLIAEPEKAIVDFLYLNLAKFSINKQDIFEESYRFQNCNQLSRKKIKIFTKLFESKKLNTVCDLFVERIIR